MYLSGPYGIFCLYVIVTISRFFLAYLLYNYFNCKYFLNIRASYQSASSGFRLLGPAGAVKLILSLEKAREILSARKAPTIMRICFTFCIFAGFRAVDARRSCERLTETLFFSFLLSC